MDEETENIINEYIFNAEDKRNACMFKGQWLGFVYYQGMADGLAQLLVDLKDKEDKKNHKEFQ